MRAWILAVLVAIVWASVLQAANTVDVYSYPNALYDMVPDGQGARAASEYLGVFNKAATSLEMHQKVKDFNSFVYEKASKFSLDELYNSQHFHALPSGARGVVLRGENLSQGYALRPGESQEAIGRGDFLLEMGMRKHEQCQYGGSSFSTYLDFKANTMMMSDETTLALHEGFLKVIDPENFHNLQAFRTRKDRHIPMEALMVLREFYEKFPNVSRLIQLYTFPLHSEIVTRKHDGQEYTVQNFRVFLRLDVIKRDYPFLAEYLEDFRDLVRSEIAVKNTSGNNILKLALDSQKDIFSLSMLTRHGKVIPFDDKGTPLFAQELQGIGLKDLEFTTHGTLFVNVFGIKFTTENIDMAGKYHREGAKASLNFKLVNIDRTSLFGKAYDNVPDWVKDLSIPKKVDDLLFGFTRQMLDANNGEGTYVNLSWDTSDSENVDFRLKASSEFLDNYYVRFAAAAIKYCFQTDGNTTLDMERLLRRALDAIIADTQMYAGQRQIAESGPDTDA